MKKLLMSVLSVLMLVSFATAALAAEPVATQKQEVGGYQVELVTPEPLTIGETDVQVKISQAGAPAQALPVKIMAEMDTTDTSMSAGMDNPKGIEQTLTEANPGEYTTKVDFSGDGKWNISIMFGDMQKATFQVTAAKKGSNLLVIGGFTGAILLFVIIIAIMRKKQDSAGGIESTL